MGISLTPKRFNGRTYWYARRCERVNGKPKIVWQKYLGRADRVVEAVEGLSDPPPPKECFVYEFGAVAALHYMAEKLDILNTVNRHVPKRRQGITVGHYLLIAAISRALCSRSKRATGPWYANTVLSAIYPHIRNFSETPGGRRFGLLHVLCDGSGTVPRLAVDCPSVAALGRSRFAP